MFRDQLDRLVSWLHEETRLPLIVRGARQVGKTWLARELAVSTSRDLMEINFERDPHAAQWFWSNDPDIILSELSIALAKEIKPEESILFLDEIQAASELTAKLRWFAEGLPILPVIAAGSLLEFTLADHSFPMPVGRVGYFQVEPMTFPEFMLAHGQDQLLGRLRAWAPGDESSKAIHMKADEWFHRYCMVGGMPAIVAADVKGSDAQVVRRLQVDLMQAFRDDFAKYSGRMDTTILDRVLLAAAHMLGRKFVLSKVGSGVKHHQISRAIDLLCQARLCTKVVHTAANGLPLAAEAKARLRKLIMLDIGMLHALTGTPAMRSFPSPKTLSSQVRNQIAEQIIGQQLRALSPADQAQTGLFYWQREGGRSGEIDYIIQVGTSIIPVELKAGSAGAMKSLHQFMYDKELHMAVRFDANPPSLQKMRLKTTQGNEVQYSLLNLPHYMAYRVAELVQSIEEERRQCQERPQP